MNKAMEKEIHPAFVEVIKQLSADEVPILNLYIKHNLNAAIVNITSKSENGGIRILYRNLLNLYKGDEIHVDSKTSSYVDNWIRLGLVGVNYEQSIRGDDVYNGFIERPEFLKAQEEEESSGRVVSIKKGFFIEHLLVLNLQRLLVSTKKHKHNTNHKAPVSDT